MPLVTLTFDPLTWKLVATVTYGMGKHLVNFGLSTAFDSPFMGRHAPG